MRATWVRPGGPLIPDQQKAKLMGIDQFFWDSKDPAAPIGLPALLVTMRGNGWKVGINRGTRSPQYPDSELDPAAFGRQLSQDLTDVQTNGQQCSVIANAETHDMDWIERMIRAFAAARPGRYLYWALEPLQAGLITVTLRDLINGNPHVWIVPEMYRGTMSPVSERAVVNNLLQGGFHEDKVKVYYDRWYEDFDGIVYDYTNAAA